MFLFLNTTKKEIQHMCMDCVRLHEELQKQQEEMFRLRNKITNLQGELKSTRYERRKLIKEKKQAQKKQATYRKPRYVDEE